MPEFGTPFSGLAKDKKVTKEVAKAVHKAAVECRCTR